MIRRPCVRGSPPQADILGITQRIFVIFSVKIASVIPAGDGFYEERDQYQLRKAQNFLGAFGAGGFSASRLSATQCLTSSTTEKPPPDLSDWQITRGVFCVRGVFCFLTPLMYFFMGNQFLIVPQVFGHSIYRFHGPNDERLEHKWRK